MSENREQSLMDLGLDLSSLADLTVDTTDDVKTEEVEKLTEEDKSEEKEEDDDKSNIPDSNENQEKEVEESEDDAPETPWGEMAQKAVESGLLTFDEEKEYEDSEESFLELVKENLEKKESEAINKFRERLPAEGNKLLDHLEKGFSIEDFLQDQNEIIDYDSIDLSEEGNQQMVVEYSLEKQGVSNDDIADQIEAFKEAGVLGKMALAAKTSLASMQRTELERKEQDRIAKLEAEKVRIEQEKAAFKSRIENTREIKGIKLSENKAKELYDYITKPVDKSGRTQFAIDDSKTDENRLLYALLVKENFDLKKLEEKAQKMTTFKLKKRLDDSKTIGASKGTSSSRTLEFGGDIPNQDELAKQLASLQM